MIKYHKTKDIETFNFEIHNFVISKRFYEFKNSLTGFNDTISIAYCTDFTKSNSGFSYEISLEDYEYYKKLYYAWNFFKEIFIMSNAIYPVKSKTLDRFKDLSKPQEVTCDYVSKIISSNRYGKTTVNFLIDSPRI